VPEPEPEPALVRPEVLAARARRRIPFWVVPVLAFLPLWAYMFHGTLEPRPLPEGDPVALGGEIFAAQCAACHGGDGGGGVAPALDQVVAHFPDFRDQMMWVRLGSTGWPGDTYGTDLPKRGGMPGFAALTDAELAKVVLYTRVTHAGLDPADPAVEEELRLIAAGEMTFAEAGLGPQAVEAGVSEDEL
jgi:mono/diheme cytochrome c family protein